MKKSHRNYRHSYLEGIFLRGASRKTVFNKVSVRKNTQIYLPSSGKTSPDQIVLLTELLQPN